MIYVIGISYSAEYAIKGIYESTVGRVTEWIRGSARTPQDDYARKVAQDYAAFLYTIPWYKFPFGEKLGGLMAMSAPTPSPVRSWERDVALGTEYFVKIGYAWLIQKALDASSDSEPRDIMLVVATLPPQALAKEPRIKSVRALTPEWQLVQTPRYKDFTEIIQGLLDQGIAVAEIAGNHEIFITVIAPKAAALNVKDTTELFSLDLDARPGFRRAGLRLGSIVWSISAGSSRPGAQASSTSMTIDGSPLSPWLRPLGRIAGALALVACGWLAIVVALTFGSAPGKSMAIIGPPTQALAAVVRANGHILSSNDYVTIARSDDAGFVGRLYAAGALLVLDAEQAGGCSGLPPASSASLRAKRSNPSCRAKQEWIASSLRSSQ